MTQNDLKRMYGSTPQSFQSRIAQTLSQAQAEQSVRLRPALRMALALCLILMLSLSAGLAVFHSQVADFFGWSYGERMKQELLTGNISKEEQSVQIGDVIFTLQEVSYIDNGLYGVGIIRPSSDSTVLLAEDYQVTDAAGYGLYYGEESRAPEGAATYADIAAEKNARIRMVRTVPEAVGVDGGTVLPLSTVGYALVPQRDGSVQFAFEISTGVAVEEGSEYTIRLWSSVQEVTADGEWLDDTWQGQSWDAVVHPVKKGDEVK